MDNSPVKHFLLKFDVAGVNGQTITNAKIRLYNTDAASAGGDFYLSDDSWQEETITWNNAPTAETNLLASLGAVSANTWVEVDVTSVVTNDGTYSFSISDSTGGADYSSKEGANAPQLVLTLGGTPAATNTPGPTNTPTQTPTAGPSPTSTVAPTATATPSQTATQPPPPAAFNNAIFVYDGDGRRVKSTINGTTTTYFVGAHYEVTNPGANQTITKYYYAGAQRIAMRTNGTLNYLLGDHLGSTSLVTDSAGNKTSEQRYKAWGETRYTFGSEATKYQYTGQFSYTSDFGLYFYNARWYDPVLGRFNQPDSTIPQSQGVQAWDRYAYTNNNPVRYTDPTGHSLCQTLVSLFGVSYSCPESSDSGSFIDIFVRDSSDGGADISIADSVERKALIFIPITEDNVADISVADLGGGGPDIFVTVEEDTLQVDVSTEDHHIATNKNFIRGPQWSNKFKEDIFDPAGMGLDDPANIVSLTDHQGPHSQAYHQWIYDRLSGAIQGLDEQQQRYDALKAELEAIGQELLDDPDKLDGP